MADRINQNFVANVTFFRGFDESVTVPLFLKMKRMRCECDELIVKEGETARELYLLSPMPDRQI